MASVLISLGSNMGQSSDIIWQAKEQIASLEGVLELAFSSLYKTKPVGYLFQDDFINAAMLIKCDLEPLELLHRLQHIEQLHKRVRTIKNGPRTLDLDIIAISNYTHADSTLTLPHPRMHERAFVLIPCAQIAPDFIVPGHNMSIDSLKAKLSDEDLNSVELLHGNK